MHKYIKEYISNMFRWATSYKENHYGKLFYSLIRIYKPEIVVELGTKRGFSSYYLAKGLFKNKKGTLDCYDLWEKYDLSLPQTSSFKKTAEINLSRFKNRVTFTQTNVIGLEKKYDLVDILHVDLGNSGEILDQIIPVWIDKVRQFIIIEGGSLERDNVDWMIKYKKLPIQQWLKNFKEKRKDVEYFTFEPYPSLTLIRKI